MKILDEKGRLFGKINVIDFLVILVILAAVVVLGIKLLGDSQSDTPEIEENPASVVDLTYTVRVSAQRAEVAERVLEYIDSGASVNCQLMAGGKPAEAYIVDCWTEPSEYQVLYTGEIVMLDPNVAQQVGLVDLCFVIEADGVDATTHLVGTQEVRLGKNHTLKTTTLEFLNGIIVDCSWETVK